MAWFWLNIPLAILFFLTWTLIPMWLVVKHPDTGPSARKPERRPSQPSVNGQRAATRHARAAVSSRTALSSFHG